MRSVSETLLRHASRRDLSGAVDFSYRLVLVGARDPCLCRIAVSCVGPPATRRQRDIVGISVSVAVRRLSCSDTHVLSMGGARSTPRWTDPHRPSAGTHAVRRGSFINVGSGHGSRTLWCLRDSGLSCLTFTVVHLTIFAHLLTLQSLGHRPAIETSHLHHMYLHHVSSGCVTRDLHCCWLVLVYAHFFQC